MDDYTLLMLHVLATQDMGTGMTEEEIDRAINNLTDEQKAEILNGDA